MERENFFTKLRRVATSTVNETASLKTCMGKPVAMRTSNGEGSSAKLVLKEMQYDAQKMKEQVSQQLQDLYSSSESFEEILDACEGLCEITKQQMEELEGYLEQYGYKKYNRVETQQPKQESKKKTKKQEKENVAPEPASPASKENSKTSTESVLCTPPKAPSEAPPVDPNKTPQLADFGISQWTMDRISHLGLHDATSQNFRTTDLAAPQYTTSAASAVPTYMYPVTPQHAQKPWMRTPFTNRTILVTPGMFGNRTIPTETPTQFIDAKTYLLDSPIPPVLMSSVKKSMPTTCDLRVSSRHDMEVTSSESRVPMKYTAWSEYSSLPAPPVQHLAPSLPAEVTPPMPECLAKPSTQAPMPTEPTRLAERFTTAPTLPSEPVQLAQKFSIDTMPSEPMSLVEKFVHHDNLPQEPMLLRQQFGLESRMPTAASFGPVAGHPSQPITPKHQKLTTLADKDVMPQTPELTLTYQRFVDVKADLRVNNHIPAAPREGAPNVTSSAPLPPVIQSAYQHDHVQPPLVPRETAIEKSLGYTIPPVTEVEFGQVAPYLQRLIPMEVFNQHLELLNVILAEKQDASFISEVEMQMLQLGKKTKSFTLLLAKLKRLYLGKKPGSTEPVYYIPK